MNFTSLPIEIFFQILNFLRNEKDILVLSQTCKYLRSLVPLKLKPINYEKIKLIKYFKAPIRELNVFNIKNNSAIKRLCKILKYMNMLEKLSIEIELKQKEYFLDFSSTRTLKELEIIFSEVKYLVTDVKIIVNTKNLSVVSEEKENRINLLVKPVTQIESITCDPLLDIKGFDLLITESFNINSSYLNSNNTLDYYVKKIKVDQIVVYVYDRFFRVIDLRYILAEKITIYSMLNTSRINFFILKTLSYIKELNLLNYKNLNRCYVQIDEKELKELKNICLNNVDLFLNNNDSEGKKQLMLNKLFILNSKFFTDCSVEVNKLFFLSQKPISSDINKIKINTLFSFPFYIRYCTDLSCENLFIKILYFQDLISITEIINSNLFNSIEKIIIHIQDSKLDEISNKIIIRIFELLRNNGFSCIRLKKIEKCNCMICNNNENICKLLKIFLVECKYCLIAEKHL